MKTLNIQQDANFMAALESIDQTAALEAFSIGGLANRVADVIPNMVFAAKAAFAKHKTDKYDLRPLNFNTTILQRAVESASYVSVSSFQVYVPMGFKGNLKDYAMQMTVAVDYANGIIERLIAFNTLVSAVLSDKNTRQSVKNLAVATAEQSKLRDEATESLKGFKNANSRKDRERLGEVYRSMGEVYETALLTEEILRDCGSIQLGDIEKFVAEASELLDALSSAAANQQLTGITPEVLKSVASSTLTVARDVELFALLMNEVAQLKVAVQDSAKEMIQAFRYK